MRYSVKLKQVTTRQRGKFCISKNRKNQACIRIKNLVMLPTQNKHQANIAPTDDLPSFPFFKKNLLSVLLSELYTNNIMEQ